MQKLKFWQTSVPLPLTPDGQPPAKPQRTQLLHNIWYNVQPPHTHLTYYYDPSILRLYLSLFSFSKHNISLLDWGPSPLHATSWLAQCYRFAIGPAISLRASRLATNTANTPTQPINTKIQQNHQSHVCISQNIIASRLTQHQQYIASRLAANINTASTPTQPINTRNQQHHPSHFCISQNTTQLHLHKYICRCSTSHIIYCLKLLFYTPPWTAINYLVLKMLWISFLKTRIWKTQRATLTYSHRRPITDPLPPIGRPLLPLALYHTVTLQIQYKNS
mgnify:CR=1 FL=1